MCPKRRREFGDVPHVASADRCVEWHQAAVEGFVFQALALGKTLDAVGASPLVVWPVVRVWR